MSEIYKRHIETHNQEVLKQLIRKNMNPIDKECFDKLTPEKQKCVSGWISRLTDEGVGPGERWESHDQVVAVAHSKCGVSRKTSKSLIYISDVDVSDFPSIVAINKETSLFPVSYTNLAEYMTNLHYRQISKVAKIDVTVVGYVIMQQEDKYNQNLLQIAIRKEYRRQGIAKQLMIDIINNAVKTGNKEIILQVRATNAPAIKLYETLGFNKNRTLTKFYNDSDGFEFVLDLSKRTFDEQKHDRDTGGKFVPKGQTGAPSKGKTSKDDAKYISNSGKEQKCGNCKFIIRQEGGDRCSKVAGIISSSGWSRFWQSSKKKEDPTKV